MEKYWLQSIYFMAFIGVLLYVEGRHPARKNFDRFSDLRAIETEENTKEVRHFSKVLRRRQYGNKRVRINKQFQKRAKSVQKEFNMHTLNRPFARHRRSRKAGVASPCK
ncbi:MAG: hypothetical protein LBF34_05540 [Puniceicoccales bacterium]|jgi:hypothetical protein|nr:hypothetical protein [Puniceicoccales bacterium]